MSAKLAIMHFRVELNQLFREPGLLLQALIYPVMFFLFFGVPAAGNVEDANLILASYAAYAFMGAAFIQFTGGIAQGRQLQWETYLHTLPASYGHRMLGWILSGFATGLLALLLVAVTALLTTGASAGPLQWLYLGIALLYGSVAIGLIAACVGYWVAPGVAVPAGSLLYLALTYAGAIWTPPEQLPAWLQHISPYLPTRLWAELAWASVQEQVWNPTHALGLGAYLLAAGVLTVWGYRREQQRRYEQ